MVDTSNLCLGFPICAAGRFWGAEIAGAFAWVICCDVILGTVQARDVTSSFLAVSQQGVNIVLVLCPHCQHCPQSSPSNQPDALPFSLLIPVFVMGTRRHNFNACCGL